MRIVALTVGASHAGSTRFRLAQYQTVLESLGATLEFIPQDQFTASCLPRLHAADVVINQKCLLGRSFARDIVKASRYLIFDFDDAIYTRPGKHYGWLTQMRVMSRFKYWLRAADLTTVANQKLAAEAAPYSRQIQVVPMGVDLQRWIPAKKTSTEMRRIGWVGAPNNLVYLERLDSVLNLLIRRYPHLRLAVFSGKRPNLSCPFEYVPFQPDGEIEFIQRLDVGLLPLDDDEYSRGKSPIKAIQYLACGVPVVGNFYGATQEICTAGNSIAVGSGTSWEGALSALLEDSARANRLGQAGRAHVQAHHDAQELGKRLWEVLNRGREGVESPMQLNK